MSQVADLEKQLAKCKAAAETLNCLKNLQGNRDFRKIIVEGFMLHEAARYVHESGDPALTPEQRADALSLAQAAGHLKRFLVVTEQLAESAASSIPELEATIDELRAENKDE